MVCMYQSSPLGLNIIGLSKLKITQKIGIVPLTKLNYPLLYNPT